LHTLFKSNVMMADPSVQTGKAVEDEQSSVQKSAAAAESPEEADSSMKTMKILVAVLGVATIALLISTIALVVQKNQDTTVVAAAKPAGENPCMNKKPDFPNIACVISEIGEQAGANVTKGYNGTFNTSAVPITQPYYQVGMCPVNVHWHLGAEHYSLGEFDENGTGPVDFHEGRQGFQCSYYDEGDSRFKANYEWKHCIGMLVGQTYEVHWPHSAAGACGTPWQYQTPFYDGVFCKDGIITDTAQQIGVQSQTFTVINDEKYYSPDLFRGMIVNGDKGTDLAIYTGSTTGTARDNEICSPFTPITWQVDRKCHLISASSFDKMCEDMKSQADSMKDDLYAHGARELVDDELAANNHQNLLRG